MELRVYNGEHFERTVAWFIGFGVILLLIIALSIRRMNFFGAIVLFLIAGGYVLFSLTKGKVISLIIRDTGLAIDTRLRVWSTLESFAIENDTNTHEVKNIVIVQKNGDIMIFSVADTQDKVQEFIDTLQEHLPLVPNPQFSTVDKLARKLKL